MVQALWHTVGARAIHVNGKDITCVSAALFPCLVVRRCDSLDGYEGRGIAY